MKKSIGWIVALVVFISAITIIFVLYDQLKADFDSEKETEEYVQMKDDTGDKNEAADPQYAAPDFTVYDAQGNTVQLSDYFGKPIVINFWASWCTYCVQEMPTFNNAYYNNPDIQFLMINVTDNYQETFSSAKAFIEGTNFDFPVFYDLDLDAATKYSASSLPMTFFINEKGELVTYFSGQLTASNLERGLAEIR